jgi:predicted RNase H-like HicB family nuclease
VKIEMIVEKTENGYSAFAKKQSVYTVGETLDELKRNILEALNLYFEEEGRVVGEQDLKITLDLAGFFDFYPVINASALSQRIGMNQSLLSQYVQGRKKPSEAQSRRILEGIRQLGKELNAIQALL